MRVDGTELASVFAVLDAIDDASGPTEVGAFMAAIGRGMRAHLLLEPGSGLDSRVNRDRLLAARPAPQLPWRRNVSGRYPTPE